MPIISLTTETTGEIGVVPRTVKMVTTDNVATITTAGYLLSSENQGYVFDKTDVFMVRYSYTQAGGGTFGIFTPSFTNGVITLNEWANPGEVTLPVVANDFANFDGTDGTIKDSGYSPTNAAKTKVVMADAATVVNNLAKFSDTAGTVADAGARIIANTTATYAGGGTSNTFTATGLTASAKGTAVIRASTNSVSITKALPGTNTLAITFSADSGAGTTVDYIYSTASLA